MKDSGRFPARWEIQFLIVVDCGASAGHGGLDCATQYSGAIITSAMELQELQGLVKSYSGADFGSGLWQQCGYWAQDEFTACCAATVQHRDALFYCEWPCVCLC